MSESSSPDAQTLAQPSPEPRTLDDNLFSSLWDYSSPALDDPIQQVATSSTATISLPSTPSTTSSLVPSSSDYMQHYTIPASAMDDQDSVPAPTSRIRTPNDKRKKVSRPPNAFMIFRSWLIRGGKLPPEVEKRQQNISKIAGKAWKLLDEPSKDMWREKALRRHEDHCRNNPGHKFELSPRSRQTDREGVRKAARDSDDDTARRLKALSDVYARDPRAVDPATSQRPRRERTSPYKPLSTACTPGRPVRGYGSPQLATGSQFGSQPTPSSITFDSQPPASVQSFGSLPPHVQPNDFAQGMAQQLHPYVFLPPGLPNHFQQAYQQENGVCLFVILHSGYNELTEFLQTIVFSENYAPVNPFSPPPGWYTGIFPPVNASGMMPGTASNITAAMLGLYELNPPYAHFNPNLGRSESNFPVHQPPVQPPPVPPTVNALPTSLSTVPLTPREQEVFGAALGNPRLSFALDDLIPLPLPLSEDGFVTATSSVADSPSPVTLTSPSPLTAAQALPKELFTEPQVSIVWGSASVMPQSPATNRCA